MRERKAVKSTSMAGYNPDPMPVDTELRRHIQLLLNAADEELIRERAEAQLTVRRDYASRHMSNSGASLARQARVFGEWAAKRIAKHVDIYLGVFEKFQVDLTPELSREIEQTIRSLAASDFSMSMLPQSGATPSGVAGQLAGEVQRIAQSALLPALNRLREFALLQKVDRETSKPAGSDTRYSASGPNARIFINSVDQSHNVSTTSELPAVLDAMLKIVHSQCGDDAKAAAEEMRASYPDRGKLIEKASVLIGLVSKSTQVMRDIAPHLHHFYDLMSRTI